MTSNPLINLSNIPGFNKLLQDNVEDNVEDNSKYLNVKQINTHEKYKVIKYNKSLLDNNTISSYGLCRSVIVNNFNQVVCFSPPKSIPFETFIQLYNIECKNVIAQELVEGTMINLFWNKTCWEISTRNIVGAYTIFYKTTSEKIKTFRDMFFYAAQYIGLKIDLLDKKYSYSFVLQYPGNRIVVPIDYPNLYLIAVYTIHKSNVTKSDSNNIIVEVNDVEEIIKMDFFKNTNVLLPKIYNYSTYSELIDTYASINTEFTVLGFVLYNKTTGQRAKVRNPRYLAIKELKGTQPNTQLHYLWLRKENKVSAFLEYYPEYKNEFSKYRQQIHAFTNALFQNYISCYIKKEKKLLYFSDEFRTNMFKLHKIYLDELKDQNLYITKEKVIFYVNNLDPILLMHCVNFRKNELKRELERCL